MFIWKKTWERMEQHLKDWEKDYNECLEVCQEFRGNLTKARKDLQQSEEALQGLRNNYVILQTKYVILQIKHAHMREVLENIRTFGGLLPRHRRSITAILDEASLQKKKRD